MTITVNGVARPIPERLTVGELVESLDLPGRGIAVAVDQVIVPRSHWATEVVTIGAEVDIVTPMQGG